MDQVTGRVVQNTGRQSSRSDHHGNDHPCDLCSESGQVISAAGFCLSCNEFLCRTCINLHNRFKANKGHTLVEGTDMPRQRPSTVKVETCSNHPDRPLEMYCTDEGVICCTMCFFEEHRSCRNVDKISNLSKNMEKSGDLSHIQEASVKQKRLCDSFREMIQKYRLTNEECHANCLEEYRSFRAEIEAALDRLGEQVSKEADSFQKKNTAKLDCLSKTISSYEQQMNSYIEEINGCLEPNKIQNDMLFIFIKRNQKQIVDIVQQLERLVNEIHIKECKFDYRASIKQSLDTECKVIEKSSTSLATKCINVSSIYIKSIEDKDDCYINGMVAISETLLVLCDYSNSCLKIADVVRKTVIKRQVLPSYPEDITSLPGPRVAVSLTGLRQIQLFNADQNLDPCGKIEVDGIGIRIHCNGDRLAVSYFNPAPRVQVLDLQGKVVRSIQHDSTVEALFDKPSYLILSKDNSRMYVSDGDKNTVTCLATSGVVQWEYKDKELMKPRGIFIGEGGCLYICSSNTHTIHVVSSDGVGLTVLPQSPSGVQYPNALLNSIPDRILYVSSSSRDLQQRNNIHRLRLH